MHCTAVTANLSVLMSLPDSYVSARAAHILAGMLSRGFTTIRDAGGADFGLAQAVDEGHVLGPKLLFTGVCNRHAASVLFAVFVCSLASRRMAQIMHTRACTCWR